MVESDVRGKMQPLKEQLKNTMNHLDTIFETHVNGGKEEGFIHGEFMPVGADGRIVLSFNLLNSNPHDWVYDWYESWLLTLLLFVL